MSLEPNGRAQASGQESAATAQAVPGSRNGSLPWLELSARRLPCPVCGFLMSAVQGSRAAICDNCGFKDGCC